MTGRRGPAVLLAVCLLGAAPGRAMAIEPAAEAEAETTRVLVLAPRLSGELPSDTAVQLRTIVADNLAEEGLEVVEAEATCEEPGCVSQAARAAGAGYVVGTKVIGDEDEFTVTVTLYAGATGEALAPFEDGCSICGFVEVRDMVRLQALDARAEVVRRRAVEAAAGAVVVEPVEPVAVPVESTRPRAKLGPAGWALVGAGSAATLGGVVLLALHQRSAGCLDNPRGGECVPVRFTTAAPGGAVLGVGVLTAAAGVLMVVLGRRADARGLQARVGVAAGGLSLRF